MGAPSLRTMKRIGVSALKKHVALPVNPLTR
jgi:hypothetical protein